MLKIMALIYCTLWIKSPSMNINGTSHDSFENTSLNDSFSYCSTVLLLLPMSMAALPTPSRTPHTPSLGSGSGAELSVSIQLSDS